MSMLHIMETVDSVYFNCKMYKMCPMHLDAYMCISMSI